MSFSGERRGSALLIVLGFVAFLIVSAVTFSIYMRQSRLPSSYLRRTATSRQLVKAALARAIDRIDNCIGSDPHPNFGQNPTNLWLGRVLIGTNTLAMVDDTVPTLTLEGLAYIPPPLVNAARYYSRMTPTAKWHRFGYDTGRYAFTVVDVSDYFDVNRMFADKGRCSAANRRLTLSYLFEEGADHNAAPAQAQAWDEFMKKFRKVDDESLAISYDGKYPLISVCDLNLAMGKGGIAGLKSYFCEYIGAQGSRAGFYNTKSRDDEERVERMTFVTDSLPLGRKDASLAANQQNQSPEVVADLADGDNQPFRMDDLSRDNASVSKVIKGELCQTKSVKPHDSSGNQVKDPSGGDFYWQNYLSGLGVAALWDYLDNDLYPISLAIPTTERHAMICGIEPMLKNNASIKVVREQSEHKVVSGGAPDQPEQVTTTVKYSLSIKDLFDAVSSVKALAAYPFARAGELTKDDAKFKVEGIFKLFFSKDKMSLRTSKRQGQDDKLRPDTANWSGIQTAALPDKGQIVVNLSPGGTSVAFDPDGIKTEKDALKLVSGSGGTSRLDLGNAIALETQLKSGNNLLLELEYTWTRPSAYKGREDEYFKSFVVNNPRTTLTSAQTAWRPVDAEGKPAETGFGDDLLDKLKGGYGASPAKLYFNAAIWLKVTSESEGARVVDMVPACVNDDAQGGSSGRTAAIDNTIFNDICGESYPLFRFDTGVEFDFSVQELDQMAESPKNVTLYPKTAIVADPRWNFAPEYWYSLGNASLDEQTWLDNCHKDQGDGDIFMFTSDQGYLQSIYELAYIPRFKNLTSSAQTQTSHLGSLTSLRNISRDGIASSFGEVPNYKFMWRMFDPMDDDETEFNKFPFVSGGRGMKVNPYSDSTNVIMAAFANTPADWRVASTNNDEELEKLSAAQFNKKYAFCAYADAESRKVKWADLKTLAGLFMTGIRSLKGTDALDWSKAWDELDWFGKEDELWNVKFDDVRFWGVDKRFLYGYWRDCFAAEQQLFLVFVRAEPLMMGGGDINQTPPQLGARAMALVWRDPKMPSGGANAPHRTRVLFYRQFE